MFYALLKQLWPNDDFERRFLTLSTRRSRESSGSVPPSVQPLCIISRGWGVGEITHYETRQHNDKVSSFYSQNVVCIMYANSMIVTNSCALRFFLFILYLLIFHSLRLHRQSSLSSKSKYKKVDVLPILACEQVLPARNESLQQSWG